MIQIGKAKGPPRAEIERCRDAVEAMLPPEMDDVAVMVTQIECREPGCAPIETAKVFKPVAEVTLDDLRAIMPELLPVQ
ncbi:hypothetical protein T492DRAFT_1109984 [Pavlovales sp. CCMP2436]|nr:hypothetical protein T492DRAFT_1109984 [Pavlovales sp. CCMP2436]